MGWGFIKKPQINCFAACCEELKILLDFCIKQASGIKPPDTKSSFFGQGSLISPCLPLPVEAIENL